MKKIPIVSAVTLLVLIVCTSAFCSSAIEGKTVVYQAGDTVMKGYLAFDKARTGKRPGVLVVHEWWGLTDYCRMRARMLAELGYTALAVDMFGDGQTALNPDDAKRLTGEVMKDPKVAEARFNAALEFLKNQKTVDPKRLAAMGYCFGGGVVLYMARQGIDLKGIVSFHGNLGADKPVGPGVIKAKILVQNGDADQFTAPTQIAAFKQEMTNAGVDYRFVSYPNAKHSFTNPEADEYAGKFNLPVGYNAAADKQSWAEMKRFFADLFKK